MRIAGGYGTHLLASRQFALTTPNAPVRAGTKQATLVDMMRTAAGASIAQMGAKTGWQPHSVRAALTGLRKRGIAVTRAKDDTETTIYRIGAA